MKIEARSADGEPATPDVVAAIVAALEDASSATAKRTPEPPPSAWRRAGRDYAEANAR